MPNGGTDNCGECHFLEHSPSGNKHCSIRRVEIESPHWTYCVNNPVTNPDGIDVPIGPVYVHDGEYPYRRVVHLPSDDGHISEKLDLLARAAGGTLDVRTRKLQVGLIQDLARQGVIEAVEHLTDLALAAPGDMTLVGFPGPESETFDLSYRWETNAVRVEFVRLAALRALRLLTHGPEGNTVVDAVNGRLRGANTETVHKINIALAFVLDVSEPP